MVYIKQDDYDNFTCIADRCPESCCKAWQIVIDDESLEKYASLGGDMGQRLADDIDWEEGVFRQRDGVCALLNDRGLCDLQLAEGEQALCYTCGMFPRHVEEFDDVRELSLSLGCPEVARQEILRRQPVSFTESEDDEEDDIEDFEDFDYLLYTNLVDAREKIYELLDSGVCTLQEKMRLILEFSRRIQACIDEERVFDLDDLIHSGDDYVTVGQSLRGKETDAEFFDDRNCFSKLFELEFLHREWRGMIDGAWDAAGEAADYIAALGERESAAGTNLLKLLIYTYFCGAVYDDMVYSKAALCVYMVRWILIIARAEGAAESAFDYSDDKASVLIRVTYQLAREIEHSDMNLNALEEFFDSKIQ